jgi:hypothetical protein
MTKALKVINFVRISMKMLFIPQGNFGNYGLLVFIDFTIAGSPDVAVLPPWNK